MNARGDFPGRRQGAGAGPPALTLIEILVVMSIMLILGTIVTGATMAMLKRVHHKNTENLLMEIARGLEQYEDEHHIFLPSDTDQSSRPLWYALEHETGLIEIEGENRFMEDTFTDPATNQGAAHFLYRDGWKLPLRYTCTDPFIEFVLRSAGPDGLFDTADDVIKR